MGELKARDLKARTGRARPPALMTEAQARGMGSSDDLGPPRDPMLLRLAVRLLAKAERSDPHRGIRLKLDRRELPELHGQVHVDALRRVELLLQELAGTGWVRLVLAREREFAGFADRNPQLELVDFDALSAWAGYVRRADHWQRRLAADLERQWADEGDGSKQALIDYLARSPLCALAQVPADEATRCLQALRELCVSGQALPLREASARVFHGRSKVLDARDELLRLLGATQGQFWEAPLQLLIDVPPFFDEALFIENLVTFERMADARCAEWRNSLLVYAGGFKASAKRLRHRGGCRVYVRTELTATPAAEPASTRGLSIVNDWLFDRAELPVRFFGDMDYAGMQILASLREVFPDALAWRPGYAELSRVVASGGGHAPEAANKERQTDPGSTGCAYADEVLLPALRRFGRFVDQEAFGADQQ
jgi:hypothetical protein